MSMGRFSWNFFNIKGITTINWRENSINYGITGFTSTIEIRALCMVLSLVFSISSLSNTVFPAKIFAGDKVYLLIITRGLLPLLPKPSLDKGS